MARKKQYKDTVIGAAIGLAAASAAYELHTDNKGKLKGTEAQISADAQAIASVLFGEEVPEPKEATKYYVNSIVDGRITRRIGIEDVVEALNPSAPENQQPARVNPYKTEMPLPEDFIALEGLVDKGNNFVDLQDRWSAIQYDQGVNLFSSKTDGKAYKAACDEAHASLLRNGVVDEYGRITDAWVEKSKQGLLDEKYPEQQDEAEIQDEPEPVDADIPAPEVVDEPETSPSAGDTIEFETVTSIPKVIVEDTFVTTDVSAIADEVSVELDIEEPVVPEPETVETPSSEITAAFDAVSAGEGKVEPDVETEPEIKIVGDTVVMEGTPESDSLDDDTIAAMGFVKVNDAEEEAAIEAEADVDEPKTAKSFTESFGRIDIGVEDPAKGQSVFTSLYEDDEAQSSEDAFIEDIIDEDDDEPAASKEAEQNEESLKVLFDKQFEVLNTQMKEQGETIKKDIEAKTSEFEAVSSNDGENGEDDARRNGINGLFASAQRYRPNFSDTFKRPEDDK